MVRNSEFQQLNKDFQKFWSKIVHILATFDRMESTPRFSNFVSLTVQ